MAAQALSAEFVDACALADVNAAAARHRGLEANVGGVSLSFYRARDGTLTCVETACPHAGHSLHLGDIEDFAGCPEVTSSDLQTPVVSCPAHLFAFELAAGRCLTNAKTPPANVYETRVDADGAVFVSPRPRFTADEARALPVPPRADADWIGERLVERGLERKFGADGL